LQFCDRYFVRLSNVNPTARRALWKRKKFY
jgi:hypothetical protein